MGVTQVQVIWPDAASITNASVKNKHSVRNGAVMQRVANSTGNQVVTDSAVTVVLANATPPVPATVVNTVNSAPKRLLKPWANYYGASLHNRSVRVKVARCG